MAQKVTINSLLANAKDPAIIGGGLVLGLGMQRFISSRIIGSETAQGLLGEENAKSLKKYLSPLLTSLIGIGVEMTSTDKLIRNVATGVAISGPATVVSEWVFGKNLLNGLNGGLLGDLLGEDEDLDGLEGEDEDLDGLDGEEEEELSGLGEVDESEIGELPIGELDNYEIGELPISGLGETSSLIIQ